MNALSFHTLLRTFVFSVLFLPVTLVQTAAAQSSGILISGGHVIDPRNDVNQVMDVIVRDGMIAEVARNITAAPGVLVVDAGGMYVTPGLIDIHTHLFPGAGRGDPAPDGFTLRSCVTTAVDAGSSGWRSFPQFKEETIDNATTRVLAFLNIGAEGYRRSPNVRLDESDTTTMSASLSADFALENREHIVGFKVAHYNRSDWTPIDRAIEAGELAGGLPIMVDFGSATPHLSLDTLLNVKFRPGDIYTHVFGGDPAVGETRPGGRESIVNTTGTVKPFVFEAVERGVVFDVGYGRASFSFGQAIPALNSGFYPRTMGTDMNYHSHIGPMMNMLNVMSAFLAMGMELPDIIEASTWSPAQVIKREEFGHLSEGAVADVAVLTIREGNFGFLDEDNQKVSGSRRLECELTIKSGEVVYDFNGLSVPSALQIP